MTQLAFWNAESTAATIYSRWIDCRGAGSAVAQLSWLGTSTPVGAFTVEFSNDPQAGKEAALNTAPAAGTAVKVDVTASIDPSAILGTGLTVNNGTNAGTTLIAFDVLPRFMRFLYTLGSGGSAAGALNGWLKLNDGV
jgi:hypothetical protein